MMTRFIIPVFAGLLLAACNDTDDSSPFSDILARSPYNSLTDSIKKQPDHDELYFRRAILLNKNNFPEPALVDFQKAWSLSKQEPYALGVSNLLLEKNIGEGIAFVQEALKVLPQSILLRLSLARAYDAQNKTDDALNVCKDILEKQPDQVNTLLLKADLLQKKGNNQEAITTLEKAVSLVPNNIDLNNKLAYQYAETKNQKAIALTDSLIHKDSLKLHTEPYYIRGLYYSNINDYTNALQWFNETIKHDYNYLNAYIEKGKILLRQEKIPEALRTFQLANTISPSFADAWYWIGKCQEESGQKQEAKTNYEKAYELDNTFTEAKEAARNIK